MREILVLGLLIALCIMVSPAWAETVPTVSTDKGDYAPWETVLLSGEGFHPGATVTLTVEWPAPDGGIHEVLPAPVADETGRISAEYSLMGESGGCGFEGTYTVVAVDSVTGQSATTTFTDAFVPPSVPSTEHWVIFQTPGLPANTYVHVTYSGTAPNGNPISATTANFREPLVVRTKPGSSFTYRNFDTTAVSGGVTYTVVLPTTPTSPFTTGGGGTYSYITATYVIKPSNSAPVVSADSDHVSVDEGQTASNSGTWSDANAGDSVTLTTSAGTVTKTGENSGGSWRWSYPATDGPAQSGSVIVTANDGKVETTKSFSLTVNNVPPTPKINSAPTTSPEGTEIRLIGSATDPSAVDTEAGFRYSWSATKNGVPYGRGDTESFSFTPDDSATYVVTLKATDKDGGEGTATASIDVTNVAPTVDPIAVPSDPVRVGSAVPVSVSFVDPGTADTHTAAWRWNNGGTSSGSVTESDGSGSVTDSITFTAPGIYTVSLTVSDKDGGSGTSTATDSIVVYDPSGGFATGGGWFTSPAGAYTAKPELAGKANFGFVSRYQKGATVPACSVEFQFKPGDLNFKSSACEWLVVSGSKATYKGVGTVNGAGNYGFLLSATEGSPDTFGIKIWDIGNENAVVYDSGGASIGGGNIVVHS